MGHKGDSDDSDSRLPSGRFVLRIDPGLHAVLRAAAEDSNLSLNEYCARKLAAPGIDVTGAAADAVERASDIVGSGLLGIVAFGSWARDELAEESDVDLLVVLDAGIRITRTLYRAWDDAPTLRWEEHPVEPHFVHLPDPGGRLSGLWAEAAVDGVVLFERAFRVSRRLVAMRRRIAAGRIIRREAFGQPYWVEATAEALAQDYIRRAGIRLRAVDVLFDAESWPDVVRESQEIVELSLKALLRAHGIDPPRIHDVSAVLLAQRDRLPAALEPHLDTLVEASRQLRRDRELAFYGAEDLTPSGFYSREDAERARTSGNRVVELVEPHASS